MFRIITADEISVLTEDPKWIRKHTNNCFILCKREKAEGVAYKGNPLLFSEGTRVYEFDGADEIESLRNQLSSTVGHLAEIDEVAIELYEANMLQNEIAAAQDDAIIEIYEMIGGN